MLRWLKSASCGCRLIDVYLPLALLAGGTTVTVLKFSKGDVAMSIVATKRMKTTGVLTRTSPQGERRRRDSEKQGQAR